MHSWKKVVQWVQAVCHEDGDKVAVMVDEARETRASVERMTVWSMTRGPRHPVAVLTLLGAMHVYRWRHTHTWSNHSSTWTKQPRPGGRMTWTSRRCLPKLWKPNFDASNTWPRKAETFVTADSSPCVENLFDRWSWNLDATAFPCRVTATQSSMCISMIGHAREREVQQGHHQGWRRS